MKKMSKLKQWLKDKKTYYTLMAVLAISYSTVPSAVFADTAGTGKIEQLISDWIAPWLTEIGAVVMLIGGVQFALAWQRQDSESKSSAMLTIMAGGMIAGIAVSYTVFF